VIVTVSSRLVVSDQELPALDGAVDLTGAEGWPPSSSVATAVTALVLLTPHVNRAWRRFGWAFVAALSVLRVASTVGRLNRQAQHSSTSNMSTGQITKPSAAGQALTFGSFNHVAKLNHQVIAVWVELLHKLPGSRLYLKAPGIGAASTAERLRGEFLAAGISRERLLLGGATPDQADHLAAYRQVDIALDPFPYNGTTTTFDALWMGVPVITLRGDRHAAHRRAVGPEDDRCVGCGGRDGCMRPSWVYTGTFRRADAGAAEPSASIWRVPASRRRKAASR